MTTITRKPRAKQDLIEQAAYLFLADTSSDASERFLAAAESAFEQLAQLPGSGKRLSHLSPALADIRQWPVPGFKNHLIFYRQTETGIDVLRVLHGARDLNALLSEEDQSGD